MQNIKYLSHSNFSINKSFTAFVLMILISLAGTIRGFSQAPIGDRQIVSSIETAIADDQLIDPDALKISSLNGIVTMESWTSNLLVKDRAVKIATSIKGVRSIIDRMSVRPAFVRDDVIQQNVKNALAYDPATESYEVNVTSDNYIVTLTGTVFFLIHGKKNNLLRKLQKVSKACKKLKIISMSSLTEIAMTAK
ncbi:MAG: BON domain-containing protein [Calditrichaeota bacterium]|nr:BON domain-containing protein [Calditrichota bacterium]